MFRLTVAVAFLVVSPSLVHSKDPSTKSKPTPTLDFDRVVADLGSPVYRVRVAASEQLAKLGKSAKPQLQALAKHQDAEVRARVGELLARLEPIPKVATPWQDAALGGGAFVFGIDIDGPVAVEAIGFDVEGVVIEEVELIELIEEEVVEVIEDSTPAVMRTVPPAGESATDAAVSSALEWIRKHSSDAKTK